MGSKSGKSPINKPTKVKFDAPDSIAGSPDISRRNRMISEQAYRAREAQRAQNFQRQSAQEAFKSILGAGQQGYGATGQQGYSSAHSPITPKSFTPNQYTPEQLSAQYPQLGSIQTESPNWSTDPFKGRGPDTSWLGKGRVEGELSGEMKERFGASENILKNLNNVSALDAMYGKGAGERIRSSLGMVRSTEDPYWGDGGDADSPTYQPTYSANKEDAKRVADAMSSDVWGAYDWKPEDGAKSEEQLALEEAAKGSFAEFMQTANYNPNPTMEQKNWFGKTETVPWKYDNTPDPYASKSWDGSGDDRYGHYIDDGDGGREFVHNKPQEQQGQSLYDAIVAQLDDKGGAWIPPGGSKISQENRQRAQQAAAYREALRASGSPQQARANSAAAKQAWLNKVMKNGN